MLKNFPFSDEQKAILRDCELANEEEVSQWPIKNVIWPLLVIFLPVLLHPFVKDNVVDFTSLIFNGSLSLLGVNILFGMSSYLVKYTTGKKAKKQQGNNDEEDVDIEADKKLNENLINLKDRLDTYKSILVMFGAAFYVAQTLFISFQFKFLPILFALLTGIILYLSIRVGKLIFLIKDDFFEKTFYGEFNNSVIETRNRWSQKYPTT